MNNAVISGRLKLEEWTDRNSGDLRKKAVIEVGQLDLLGKKEEEQKGGF
jgi:single-stranded DNA-binding protein